MPNSYSALTTSGDISHRLPTHKLAKPRTSSRVKSSPRIRISVRQFRSPGSKKNWTIRPSSRWSSPRRACQNWRRLSTRVTSATRLRWAFLGLQLLLLVLHIHPPRAPFLRGSPPVGGEHRRRTPIPRRHDISPSFTISYLFVQ